MEFLKSSPRFSFLLDGKDAFSLDYTKSEAQNGNELVTTYTFGCGLKVTNVAKKHERFGVYEWVNYFENTSKEKSPIISELWDADATFPCAHQEKRDQETPILPTRDEHILIYNPLGCSDDEHDFETFVNDSPAREFDILFGERTLEYKNARGRSSNGRAPFFNLHQHGAGWIYALGWSGQWNARFTCTGDSVNIRGKIEDTEFYLEGGEKIRTASTFIMPYTAELEDSFNLWRRFVLEEISVVTKRTGGALFTAAHWGGVTSDKLISRINAICDASLPYDYIWVDAGWYGQTSEPTPNEFIGTWGRHLGDFRVSPLTHPDGFVDVARTVHERGKKFLLWFEPERVRKQSDFDIDTKYLLESDEFPKYYLVNLGDEGALEYIYGKLSSHIEKLGIDCMRQDFNTHPLSFWRQNDKEGRRGITEIKYITGLYRLWDMLLERFPSLIIDDCASGGRRIDIEMLRRAVPLWRSDAQTVANPNPVHAQLCNMNISRWMPYSGTGTGRVYDLYRFRSAYGAAMQSSYTFADSDTFEGDAEKAAWLKKYCDEYVSVRDFFLGDMYHLTAPVRDETSWRAVQWNRPEKNDGLVQVFADERAPYTDARFVLKGIDSCAEYIVRDIDGGEWTVSGREISERGVHIHIEEKRAAKLYIYKKVN